MSIVNIIVGENISSQEVADKEDANYFIAFVMDKMSLDSDNAVCSFANFAINLTDIVEIYDCDRHVIFEFIE